MTKIFAAITAILLLTACKGKPAEIGEVDAYVPVYSDKATAQNIKLVAPQTTVAGGKIASAANYVFQVEESKGIHITDYSNPAVPVKKAFIQIPQCHELTIKGNYIYTNNMADLVVIEMQGTTAINVTSRITNAFPDLAIQYPPAAGAYFVCPNTSKGEVIAWQLQKVNNPKCKRP